MAIVDLWTEKYRPKNVDDYVFKDESQKHQVETWIKTKTIPNLLFSGSAGIGKTTLAKLLVHQLEIDDYDVLYVNASRENGIGFIREKVHPFCQTMPFGDMKVVLLDEADRISPQGQDAMKATMEEYSQCVRFILTTNHPNKITPPLHSRCQGFHFAQTDHTEFTARVATVLVTEGVEFDLDTLDSYVKATYPDLRKCLNSVQQHSTTGKLLMPSSADKSMLDWRIDAVDLFKKGKIKDARALICGSANPEDVDEIFRWMYDNLELWGTTEEDQDSAIIIIRQGLVNHSLCADPEINLSATICELCRIKA